MLRETEGTSAAAASLSNVERFPQEPIRRLMRASRSLPSNTHLCITIFDLLFHLPHTTRAQPQRCAHGHGKSFAARCCAQTCAHSLTSTSSGGEYQDHVNCLQPVSISHPYRSPLSFLTVLFLPLSALHKIFRFVLLSCAQIWKLLMLLVPTLMLLPGL